MHGHLIDEEAALGSHPAKLRMLVFEICDDLSERCARNLQM